MKQLQLFLKAALCLTFLLIVGVPSSAHAQAVMPQKPPPSPSLGSLDIGRVGRPGATIVHGNAVRIWGSGRNIWGKHDQFHYAWIDLPGDGQLVAEVLSQDATDDWAKAGIMLRESVAGNAANVFLALTPKHGVTFQWRGATKKETKSQYGPQVKGPTWLKLLRHDKTVTGFVSEDGATWVKVGFVNIKLQSTSSIGLAVTAHNNHVRSRAVFTHVTLTSGSTPASLTATRVYGQAGSFLTNTDNNGGISASSLSEPIGIASDHDGNLYVADYDNSRVLYYPAGSTTATQVYGQGGSFLANTANNGGISASSLYDPWGVALDGSGNLYVVDYGNNRMLMFPHT